METYNQQISHNPKGVYSMIKPKRKLMKCATCGKFISDSQAVFHNVIEGFPAEPYHSDCSKP